jgi:hypothetical protein
MSRIIDDFPRAGLAEGRNSGLGFAIVVKDDDKFRAVMPFSACKDYLNDVIYAENIGKLLPSIYGFEYTKINNIFNDNYFYLGLKTLNPGTGSGKTLTNDMQELENKYLKNMPNIIKIVNYFEDIMLLDSYSTIEYVEDGYMIIKVNEVWGRKLFLISFLSLLLRMFYLYDGSVSPEEAIKIGSFVYPADVGFFYVLKKKCMYTKEFYDIDQGFSGHVKEIHNSRGIVSFTNNMK